MIKDMRILLLTCYFNNLRSNIAAFDASGGFLECHLSPFPFYRREKLFGDHRRDGFRGAQFLTTQILATESC